MAKPVTAAQKKSAAPAKKETAKSTAIATVNKSTAVIAKSVAEDLLADSGMGMETATAKDMAIPRISVLQSLSPQCTKGDQQFVKGAEPGDFWDNVEQKVFAKAEEGFLFIPVKFRAAYLEWTPRSKGGGFAGDHGADDSILSKTTKNDAGANMLPNGNEIVATAEYYVIALDLDGKNPRQAVISFSKTQLKKSKRLIAALKMFQAPHPIDAGRTFNPAMFYSAMLATTVPESNDKGSWMGWNIVRKCDTFELPDGHDLYASAKAFVQAVTSGAVKVADYSEANTEVPAQSDDDKL